MRKNTKTTQEGGEFHLLDLCTIAPDQRQPRQSFDPIAHQELTTSIKDQGVLQPIMVRPDADGFMIVAGERRYRAAIEAGLAQIPAIIRELTDEEALEIQLTENLLRKDVHPLEEAQGFAKLRNTYTLEQISNRVGKSPSFIAKRCSLIELIEMAQKLFLHGHMDLEDALRLAKLSPEAQLSIIDEVSPNNWRNRIGEKWKIGNINYYCNQSVEHLDAAKFDLNDAELYPEAGACTGCIHNTGNQQLLFEDQRRPSCLRPHCFSIKSKKQYEKSLEDIALDPTRVTVVGYIHSDADKMKLKAAQEKGITVLERNDYDRECEIDLEFQEYNEWVQEEYEYSLDDEDFNEDDAKEEYRSAREEWQRELKEQQDAIANGEIIKAFVIAGSGEGGEMLIRVNKKKQAVVNAVRNAGDEASAAVEGQIQELVGRERRNKELDGEKVWTGIRELIAKPATGDILYETLEPLSSNERVALFHAMRDKLNYPTRMICEKHLGSDYRDEQVVTESMLLKMSRIFLIDVLVTAYGSHLQEGSKNALAYEVIKHYLPQEVATIELAQTEKAMARIERLEKRIADLKKSLPQKEQ